MAEHRRTLPWARNRRTPRLQMAADPALLRMWTLTWIGTAIIVASSFALMLTGHQLQHWYAWLLIILLAAPAVRPGWPATAVSVLALVIMWLLAWPGPTLGVALIALGWHTALTVWLLGATVPSAAVLHRSAFRVIALRWLWIQLATQLIVLVAGLTRAIGQDNLIGTLGVLALLGIGIAMAVIVSLPHRVRDRTGHSPAS